MDAERIALQVLRSVRYAAVATVQPNGEPWNSPLRIVFDDELDLFWFSDRENQHSVNVRKTPRAFAVFFDPTVPEGEELGVYLDGAVEQVEDEATAERACTLLDGDAASAAGFLGDANRRVYRLAPERAWINEAEYKNGTFLRDYRIPLDLDAIRAALKRASDWKTDSQGS